MTKELLNGSQESHDPLRISFSGHQKAEQRLCRC